MKLILCTECNDVVKLRTEGERACWCGKSGGHYLTDGLNARIWGKCIPLGFDNYSLRKAKLLRPEMGLGQRFDAFVIPHVCPTIRHLKRKSRP